MSESEDVYNMDLHDEIVITSAHVDNEYSVLRVPGGWIYSSITTSVFVPYDEKFQIKEGYRP